MPSAPACRRETGALWLSAFVMGNVVLQWPIGWLADHADRRPCWPAARWPAPLLVLLLSAAGPGAVAGIIGVVLLWGGISFAIYPVGLALLGQRFRGGDIARANTAFSLIYILGGLVGRPVDGCGDGRVRRARPRLDAGRFLWPGGVAALLALRRRR